MGSFRCPACKKAEGGVPALQHDTVVYDLFVANGAFANLVFRFWNWWPLEKKFVAALAKRCGTAPVLLYERV